MCMLWVQESLQTVVSHLMWMLGTKLRSFARASHLLTIESLLLYQQCKLKKKKSLFVVKKITVVAVETSRRVCISHKQEHNRKGFNPTNHPQQMLWTGPLSWEEQESPWQHQAWKRVIRPHTELSCCSEARLRVEEVQNREKWGTGWELTSLYRPGVSHPFL